MSNQQRPARQRGPISDGLTWLGSALQDLREKHSAGDVLRLGGSLPESFGPNDNVQEKRLRFLSVMGIVRMAREETAAGTFKGFTWTVIDVPPGARADVEREVGLRSKAEIRSNN